MRIPGRIMCLDLSSSRTGFCIGAGGKIERKGSFGLKDPEDEPRRASKNLGRWLRDQFSLDAYEQVFVEAAFNPAQMHHMGNSAHTVALTWRLVGALDSVAACYGVRVEDVKVSDHRKHVTGSARHDSRDLAKAATLAALKARGLIDRSSRDDDMADAIAIFCWANAQYNGIEVGDFSLRGLPGKRVAA